MKSHINLKLATCICRSAAVVILVLVFVPVGIFAGPHGPRMNANGTLFGDAADFMQSADGRFRVVMQQDCNLVLYKGRHALWASGTNGKGQHCRAIMQTDGNLVVYTGNRPLWASGTQGHGGAFVIAQNDGNLVVYQGQHPLWASGTNVPEPESRDVAGHPAFLRPGESLNGARNDFLQAPGSGQAITFRMQTDCNLVLYDGSSPMWASGTQGKSNDCKAIMQGDGNLVIYGGNGRVVWASGTQGKNGAFLQVQDDGNTVLYVGNRQPIWATGTDCNSNVVLGSLSTSPQETLSWFTEVIGVGTTGLKKIGVGSRWEDTHCNARGIGRAVRDAQHSTDGLYTIDVQLLKFALPRGGFVERPNGIRFMRLEVRPLYPAAHNFANNHNIKRGDVLAFAGPVRWDIHDKPDHVKVIPPNLVIKEARFLEVHPVTLALSHP
jgi:hypothetical protein